MEEAHSAHFWERGLGRLAFFEKTQCCHTGVCRFCGRLHIKHGVSGPGVVPWVRRAPEYPKKHGHAHRNGLSNPLRELLRTALWGIRITPVAVFWGHVESATPVLPVTRLEGISLTSVTGP